MMQVSDNEEFMQIASSYNDVVTAGIAGMAVFVGEAHQWTLLL